MSDLTIQQIVRDVAGMWRTGAAIVGISVAAAVAWAVLAAPVYRAEVLLMPASSQESSGVGSQLGGLAALAGVSLGTVESRKAEAVATLQSRVLTDAFVKEKQLLPVLFAKKWDPYKGGWREGIDPVPTLWDANKLIDSKIREVQTDKKSGLITLSIEWTDARQAAEWANDLVVRANNLLRMRATQDSERNIQFLEQQINATSIVEMRQSLYHLVENELKTIMMAQTSQEYAFKVVDPAVAPQEKIRPKRLLIVVGGLIAGVFLSVCLALIAPPPRKA